MNMRSQLDPSVYSSSGRGSGSIDEVLGAVQGVMSIVGKSKERAKEQKELEQNDFLNTTFGNHLAGWDGKDQEDFKQRTNSAMTEVLTQDPALYKKTTSFIADAAKTVYDAQDQQKQLEEKDLIIAAKKLENEGKETSNKSAEQDLYNKQIANKEAEFKYISGVNGYIGHQLSSVKDQRALDAAFLNIQMRTGITPEQLKVVPKDYNQFSAQADTVINSFMSDTERQKKELDDIKLQSEKIGLGKAKSDATVAEVNAKYAERDADQKFRKGEVEITKAEREANKPEPSAMDGIDPETGKPYTAVQSTNAGYALRAVEANQITEGLYNEGFDAGKIANAIMKPDKLNLIKDPVQRQYAQAARNFINSILRPESGAVIAESEFRDAYRQYFAQPGDDLGTQEQKRLNRLQKIAGLKATAGTAYDRAVKEYESLKSGAAAPPKGIQAGESFTHKNGVVITREK